METINVTEFKAPWEEVESPTCASTFKDAALAMLAKGVPVIPLREKSKNPCTEHAAKEATLHKMQVEKWSDKYPNANVGCVATDKTVWMLDDDNGTVKEDYEKETGLKFPETFAVCSSGAKRHYYFKQTEGSRRMGNTDYDVNGKEMFSARVYNRYVVGAGSIHPMTGKPYVVVNDVPIAPAPDSLIEWIQQKAGKKVKGNEAELKPPYQLPETLTEGTRNKELFRFASSLRAKGMEADEILAALEIANKRCSPPLSLTELQTITNSAMKYEAGTGGVVTFGSAAQSEPPDAEVLNPATVPAKTDFIADMSDAVLDGRLGEIYQKRLSPTGTACGFPISYGWTALTTVAGVMVPRTVCSGLTLEPPRTNLYVVQIGSIHSGKSLVINRAKSVLGLPDVMYSDAKAGSAEGLLKKLNKEFHSGMRSDRLLQDLDEWKYYFRKAEIDGASFMTILNTGFYKDRYNITIAGGVEIDFKCSISWIGGVVQEEYSDVVGAAALGGFYDRLYQGVCPSGFNLNYFPHEGMPEEVNPKPVEIDGSVWEVAREWRTKNSEIGRAVEVVIRVAHICASFDGRPVLYGRDLDPAKALLDEQMRVREMFKPNIGENPDAKCMLTIKSWLRKVAPNGEWVSMRDLQRGISYDRFGAIVFSRCLQALASPYAREIETHTIKGTGRGRGKMVVRLVEAQAI